MSGGQGHSGLLPAVCPVLAFGSSLCSGLLDENSPVSDLNIILSSVGGKTSCLRWAS